MAPILPSTALKKANTSISYKINNHPEFFSCGHQPPRNYFPVVTNNLEFIFLWPATTWNFFSSDQQPPRIYFPVANTHPEFFFLWSTTTWNLILGADLKPPWSRN